MNQIHKSSYKINCALKRYPDSKMKNLYAWDSSDELALDYLGGQIQEHLNLQPEGTSVENLRILIVNDQFGSLCEALQDLNITAYTDSYISSRATQLNTENRVHPLNQIQSLKGLFDMVLVRMPKNMSFFEDILCHLTHHLHPKSKIICSYMLKHQSASAFDLLNQYIGETSTTLAKKKARLILAHFQKGKVESPYPIEFSPPRSSFNPPFEIPLINHSNLFSREKLDIGTRFLLGYIPQGNYKEILDLGCGNGIIGIAAKKLNPQAQIIFSDESEMAIQSARANYEHYFQDQAQFHWTNCFENQESNSVDLVLCNPPFHQGNTLGDFIARQMFNDARRVLRLGGRIRVIGNRHLQYQNLLKRIFKNSERVAENTKFIILDSVLMSYT